MVYDIRTEAFGGIYHVIQRGNNKKKIFQEGRDKGFFIKHLRHFKEPMQYKILGYVIMDNHYHLILQTFREPLCKIMHRMNLKYSKYYNYKYDHIGHVFQGPYKAILVNDANYLVALLRYIHQNPVKAKLCERISEYDWSSDLFYRGNIQDFVDTEIIFTEISTNKEEAIRKYKDLMDDPTEENGHLFERAKQIGEGISPMGNKNFMIVTRWPLDDILKNVVENERIFGLIKAGSRKRSLTKYKISYIKKAVTYGYTMEEIGESMGVSKGAVNHLIQRKEKAKGG